MNRPAQWREKALCRADPSLWDSKATAAEAIHICRSHCPVLQECKAWAVGAGLVEVTAGGIAWNSDGSRNRMDRSRFARHNAYCRVLEQAEEG